MERIKYETITGMHFEATTKCGALCAMCGRNFKGKVREDLPLTELTLNDCKQIFEPNFIKQLQFISICGVYGDPIYASEIIEIIDYFYKCNGSLTINFYTNGSIHSRLWWRRLAKSIKRGYVIFGIDGIGETHSIHRCNTDYYKVIENAKSYIDADHLLGIGKRQCHRLLDHDVATGFDSLNGHCCMQAVRGTNIYDIYGNSALQ